MNGLKGISSAVLLSCAINVMAERAYILGNGLQPTEISTWPSQMGQKNIHRGRDDGSNGGRSCIFIRGHAGEFNPSRLGEGFRLVRDIDEEISPISSK